MTDLLKQIAGHLTVMMGSAQPHIEGEEVTGYTIKTGSLHKLIGLLAGAGHPVIVPVVRWTGAPCHGMGGAHRCGDHRCTKDYCAAFGVPVAPAAWDGGCEHCQRTDAQPRPEDDWCEHCERGSPGVKTVDGARTK